MLSPDRPELRPGIHVGPADNADLEVSDEQGSVPRREPFGVGFDVVMLALVAGLLWAAIALAGWWSIPLVIAAFLLFPVAARAFYFDVTVRDRDSEGEPIHKVVPPLLELLIESVQWLAVAACFAAAGRNDYAMVVAIVGIGGATISAIKRVRKRAPVA